jgi:tRNA threonylcarbamoyladenosine biosynthesis protein TsaE
MGDVGRRAARVAAGGGIGHKGAAVSLPLEISLPDETATAGLAASLARRVARGDVIGLRGPLGSGKTSFARAFIRALGRGDEEVPSPTFTLAEIYAFPGRPAVWHFDLYRLKDAEEAWELGLEEAFADGVALIEWPERLGGAMPAEALDVALSAGPSPAARIARLAGNAAWAARLRGIAA